MNSVLFKTIPVNIQNAIEAKLSTEHSDQPKFRRDAVFRKRDVKAASKVFEI